MAEEHDTYSRRLRPLKNGSVYQHDDLMEMIGRLNELRASSPVEFFELVKSCRFPGYHLPAACMVIYKNLNLCYRNEIRDIVKDIILSSVSGRTIAELEVKSPLDDGVATYLLC